MFSLTENVAVLIAVMAASLALMLFLNRVWPCEKRRHGNDLVGWQLSVLGTTYAVILGFMLYTVWTNFGAASVNADLEANSLRNVYRLAEGLPPDQRARVQAETIAYASAVIENDWPDMAKGVLPERTHRINEDMWQTLMSIQTTTPSQSTAEDHAISELSELTAHRRTRLLQTVYRLPAIFWAVLLTGAVLTLLSVNLFGSSNTRIHALQVFSSTLLITLTMLAIADVNQPFQGWVRVDSVAFDRALQSMRSER